MTIDFLSRFLHAFKRHSHDFGKSPEAISEVFGGTEFQCVLAGIRFCARSNGFGMFINAAIDFTIIATVVFVITKALIEEAPAPPGPKTKTCRDCGETVLDVARKCKWCGSSPA